MPSESLGLEPTSTGEFGPTPEDGPFVGEAALGVDDVLRISLGLVTTVEPGPAAGG